MLPLVVVPSWDSVSEVVWHRRGLQCSGDGATGAQSGGPLQLLWKEVHSQDSVATGGPTGRYS